MGSSFGVRAQQRTKVLISDLPNDRSDRRSIYIDSMALPGVAVTSLMHCISSDCLPVRV